MIILEGPDLVGKTTLAHAICHADQRNKYEHLSRHGADWHYLYSYLPLIRANNVFDRFHISEPVYSEVRGEKTPLESGWAIAITREAIKVGCLTVIMTATPELIERRYIENIKNGRFEMYTLAQILQANELFRLVALGSSIQGCQFHCDIHLHVEADIDVKQQAVQFCHIHQLMLDRSAYLRSTRELPRVGVKS